MFLYKIGEKKKNEWCVCVCVCVCAYVYVPGETKPTFKEYTQVKLGAV